MLDFGGGRQQVFSVYSQATGWQRIQLLGGKGRLEIEIPFNAPQDAPVRYWVDAGTGVREVTVPSANQYQLQAEAFSQRIRTRQPDSSGLDDATCNMRVINALFASARSGQFERP